MAEKTKEKFDDKGMIRVFVYGTLKKGHGNHRLLEEANAVFMGYDSITGPFKMQDMMGFPGVYRPLEADTKIVPQPLRIRGEVWAMEPEGLAALDMLEGHPNFYRREKMWTNGTQGEDGYRAWMYLLNGLFLKRRPTYIDPKRTLPEGIWHASDDEKAFWKGIAA